MRPVQNRAPTGVGAEVYNMHHERSLLDTRRPPEEEDDATMESLSLPVTESQTTKTETTVSTSTSPAESTVQTLSQGQSSEQGEGALSENIANRLGKVSLSKSKLTAKERREKIKQACEAKGIKYDLTSKGSKNWRRRRLKIQLPNQEPLQVRWGTRAQATNGQAIHIQPKRSK
ncbi:hypothetical protein FQR65_LT10442 [Abscondita terminalis]|nr:hypothetical protein FQR65_LT10442 [Abscondita terminalis]